ncbi:hypothetical protein [Krasilnikoviella flava]|uniref:Uncharacterized protein n=1 Tax=Krasilnikoviella flava TaxID=526729 RepID=A0A1T5IE04_9MICO|nr:hypothetical protein [Krasilnikoviella flava]SKC37389.1 hypothetical protein SAMN04324258_0399 [Krasilnikoviella flava]
MKTFYFHELKSHGVLGRSSTQYLLPSRAVVRADSLSSARRFLRDVGLSGKSYRIATASEARLIDDFEPGTVAWTTADMTEGEWVIRQTVDEYVREHPRWADLT